MLGSFLHEGRLRRFAVEIPIDWFDQAGTNAEGEESELDLAVWLHGETDAADTFLRDRVKANALLNGVPLALPGTLWNPASFAAPAGAPWTPTRYIPGQTKVKAVHIAPQGIGFGGPALDYAGWVDIALHAGEDTGLWNNVAGLASAVLPDDDVSMLAALVGRVEQILIDQLFKLRGRRLNRMFRNRLLAGQGCGGMQVLKVRAERPDLFDAWAVIGGSTGGVLKNGVGMPEVEVTYAPLPGATVAPLLFIHHQNDKRYDVGGGHIHDLHSKWCRDTSVEFNPTIDIGFFPHGLFTTVDTWVVGYVDPASIVSGFSVYGTSGEAHLFLEDAAAVGLRYADWPSFTTEPNYLDADPYAEPLLLSDWTFDGAALVWSWFMDVATP